MLHRLIRFITIFMGMIFCFQVLAFADKPTAIFLKTEPGTRLFSMGGVSNSGNYQDIFFSPCELGWLVNKGINLSRWSGMIENSSYNFLSSVLPFKKSGALDFGYLGYDAGMETIEGLDGSLKNIKLENNNVLFIGYGKNINEKVSIGGNVKYLSTTLAEEYNAKAILMDAGLSFHTLDERHKISLGIKNFGQNIKYLNTPEPPPTSVHAGYALTLKLGANHKIIIGGALDKGIYDKETTFSSGVEYYPGLSFFSLRAGLKNDGNRSLFAGGIGLNYGGMELNAGYGMSNEYTKNSPLRISFSWMPGPLSDYERANEYLNRRMRAKAMAMWGNIRSGEKGYSEAQMMVKRYRFPPELMVEAILKDKNGDGILAGGETGILSIKITNKGKSTASDVRLILNPQKDYDGIIFQSFGQPVGNISPEGKSEVNIQITADKEVDKLNVPVRIIAKEKDGVNSPDYTFTISSKPYNPPVLALGEYTFREDNSGYSIGNANGIVEEGEQIEVTGFVLNMGESEARNVVFELVSNSPDITVIPEISKVTIGNLQPGEYKKIVCGFKVEKKYKGLKLPVSVNLIEERKRFSAVQPLEIMLGKPYTEAIVPSVTLAASRILPALAAPITTVTPFAAKESESERGKVPELMFDEKILPDKNQNKIYEPGEEIEVVVGIRNTGGPAKDVRVSLSGDETIIKLLGNEKKVGDISSGQYQEVRFYAPVPADIPRKEAVFQVAVKEGRGYSPGTIMEERVALMPAEIRVVKKLPGLQPSPNAYKDQRKNGGAVIVGIGDYQKINKLQYAVNDATMVKEYLNGVFGIPERNIRFLPDAKATKATIETAVRDWLTKKDFDFIVFYYAGHGIPVPDQENTGTGDPYIIPYDGDMELGKGTFVSIKSMVSLFEESKATDGLLIFDACFSGAGGRSPELSGQRQVAIMPSTIKSNRMVVFSSTTGTQPSYEFDKVKHGYFTYYFLLGLKEGAADNDKDGWVSLPELYDFTKRNLDDELEGKQIPTISDNRDVKLGKYK